jgi:hypothetical protein
MWGFARKRNLVAGPVLNPTLASLLDEECPEGK